MWDRSGFGMLLNLVPSPLFPRPLWYAKDVKVRLLHRKRGSFFVIAPVHGIVSGPGDPQSLVSIVVVVKVSAPLLPDPVDLKRIFLPLQGADDVLW